MAMKMRTIGKTPILLVASLLMPFVITAASLPTEPLGGKPPAGAKQSVKDLDYQVKYQRAFEAVLWSMPAVGMYAYWHAAADWGAGSNAIIAWSKPSTPYMEGVTGNNQTPYILSQTDLSKGPVVLEVPAATDKATLYGQVVDHWQISIADVGPSGLDKGKGGKILFTPPGYTGKVPAGYVGGEEPELSHHLCLSLHQEQDRDDSRCVCLFQDTEDVLPVGVAEPGPDQVRRSGRNGQALGGIATL